MRIHIIEAKDLEKKDITFTGKGKSDPYAIIEAGDQRYKTHTIGCTVDPQWDYWCEVKKILILLGPLPLQDILGHRFGKKLHLTQKCKSGNYLVFPATPRFVLYILNVSKHINQRELGSMYIF